MYANTCWGLLGLAVTFGMAMLGLPPNYIWLQPYFMWAAIACGAVSVLCFLWPAFRRFSNADAKNKIGPLQTSLILSLSEPAFEVLQDGKTRKSFGLMLRNGGQQSLTNCWVQIKGIAPNPNMHMPLSLLPDAFPLHRQNEHRAVKFVSYLDGADDFKLAIPFSGTVDYSNSIPSNPCVITIEAASDQSKNIEKNFRLRIIDGSFSVETL